MRLESQSRRIALVGIDGAGKSTVTRRFFERAPAAAERTQVVHCPQYHEGPNAPLQALSRSVEAFSRSADGLRCYELKASALYLQMTLFGPVADAIEAAFRPQVLLCERHPVVDSLAYGPFYQRMVQRELDADSWEERLRNTLDEREPGAYDAVRRWHAVEQRRLGTDVSFWRLPNDVCEIFERPLADRVEVLSGRYRTALPDAIVLLDVDPEEAQRRVKVRDGDAAELHESTDSLRALRQSYLAVLEELRASYPGLAIHVVESGDEAAIDDTVIEIARHLEGGTTR